MRTILLNILLSISGLTLIAQVHYPFQNPQEGIEKRVADLIARLTLEEKTSLMLYGAKPVDRMGIPGYNWWNECLHGVARAGRATVFPQAIGLAATFDEELVQAVAQAISDEGRAKYNEAIRLGYRNQYLGLTYWTPNINIFRDPRWGRGQETFGEDPFLTSRMGLAFVKGLQGDNPLYLKVAACAKHFAVHSGPEALRHHFNALVDDYDLWNTYLPAFKHLINGGVAGVMCAYNRTNNEPCCGSNMLLTDILRNKWGFDGYVVSDCWALQDIWAEHKYVADATEAAALAIRNGVNMNCGVVYNRIPDAVAKGLISEKEVDRALAGSLKILFRLGWFDPIESSPWANLGNKDIASPAHKALARRVAASSIVLLKNNGILPLPKNLGSVFVTGPNAVSLEALWANYNGLSGELVTVLEGVVEKVSPATIVNFNEGCRVTNDTLFRGIRHAERCDVTIAVMGLNSLLEGEAGDAYLSPYGGDRNDINLPENQVKFIKSLKKGGKPLVLVVMAGSAISLRDVEPYADAILYAWYPGEQGGNAIADVIFGDVNPSGRLPVTFYNSVNDLPPFEDYSMRGRTYRYFEGDTQYPFGFGLSYTQFDYGSPKMSKKEYGITDNIDFEITITNVGKLNGDEIVQVYARCLNGKDNRLIKTLIGFKRVNLKAGENQTIHFSIPVKQLESFDSITKQLEVHKGIYALVVGGSSSDVRHQFEINVR
jgi:beta-glucosidase